MISKIIIKKMLRDKIRKKNTIWFVVSMPPCTALVWSDMLYIITVVTSGVYLASVYKYKSIEIERKYLLII